MSGRQPRPGGELARAAARGDAAARSRLIASNMGLVVATARRYRGRGLDMDDLVGEGSVGLVRAADGFREGPGVPFAAYALWWIRQAILLALEESAPTIRVPSHTRRLLARWRRLERAMAQEHGAAPDDERVAAELGLTARQLVRAR